ncbi:hypothetical protein AM493_05355 [Flavobacterium akiainvivens]|uniref:Uncharacterized protein n=1 Tax=Flavobacterium akiainvivens TaxID=1202724 RepID=A0A0M8MG28_9FLAO|nr:hypothetical protein [Flavobacterium akiainvivens]KOS05521.1 hypothetical protein AM493_05355 [Flavobacterium akiainvivens]SFQ33569.1 hypothetical protein SAMN05444144_103106 [Flavobacterium akiainvivens]
MKPATTTRILAGLSFLIFFCPFFEKCSFNLPSFSRQPTQEKTTQQLLAEKKENTYSGYRLAGIGSPVTDEYSNLTAHFLIIVILSVAILFFALRGSFANVFWFSAINLVLLAMWILVLLPVYMVLLAMLRYGYLMLISNTIALMVYSRKAYKQKEDEPYL